MEATLLKSIGQNTTTDSLTLAQLHSTDHEEVLRVLRSLSSFQVVDIKPVSEKVHRLTEEGQKYSQSGSPEAALFSQIDTDGTPTTVLQNKVGKSTYDLALSQLMKCKAIRIDSGVVKRNVQQFEDHVKEQLNKVQKGASLPEKDLENLKRRKLITVGQSTKFVITKGPNFSVDWVKPVTEITQEMISNGSWKTTTLKPYNLQAKGAPILAGHLHPLLKVRSEFRNIFIELGFEEMPTNNFVESSFWNFDALFQPQQHPARDAHDTFFLSEPANTLSLPEEYVKKVKDSHERGTDGSLGWQYEWSEKEARKNVLRTHTTAVSSRMLYKLAQDGFKPKKYFSIDRVFRNESLDATHLAEFHQIEGVVADYNIGLVDLMGIISIFFQKIGVRDLHFKPAFNPYTEPSMEIFGYHVGLKRLIEVGNSGVFRPEMLLPMGLPPNVNVLGWSLSLERPTMISYGISNIRSMIGNKTKLSFIENNKICMF